MSHLCAQTHTRGGGGGPGVPAAESWTDESALTTQQAVLAYLYTVGR